jgi:hypothetical protein
MSDKSEQRSRGIAILLAWFQGIYYVVAGFWPIPAIDSFMLVTGPKTDIWLVKTVGLLLVAIGAVLCLAARRRRVGLETSVLAIGAALALTVIELVYVANGTISGIYLLDAVVEVCLAIGWLLTAARGG